MARFRGPFRIRVELRDLDERYLVVVRYKQRKALAIINLVAEYLVRLLRMWKNAMLSIDGLSPPAICSRSVALEARYWAQLRAVDVAFS